MKSILSIISTVAFVCSAFAAGYSSAVSAQTNDSRATRAEATASTGEFTQISVGIGVDTPTTCALKRDGSVICWGDGLVNQADAPSAKVAGSFTRVSVGEGLTCGLTIKHKVVCWGDVRGNGEPVEGSGSIKVEPATYAQVSAGGPICCGDELYPSACAVSRTHRISCWGISSVRRRPASSNR